MTSFRIGDSISRGGTGAPPIRFAGLQYGRNFLTRPHFVTMPLPTVTGSATLPSTVDVYIDNVLKGSQKVEPGPFDLREVPINGGAGKFNIVVRTARPGSRYDSTVLHFA